MSWFRRIAALVLLALWVPATSHCAVETILGWANDHCETACSHGVADMNGHPASDACAMVEGGDFKPAFEPLIAPAPSLTVLACLRCVHAVLLVEATPLAPPAWAEGNPRDWVPVCVFARRAALPARAPDALG